MAQNVRILPPNESKIDVTLARRSYYRILYGPKGKTLNMENFTVNQDGRSEEQGVSS